ncbi:amidohydrolase [Gemmatirosa kalamazoonensis]|uniref:Amidohydrolase n=1 Tax=Gemmatirosa kalamazoonensis TaxID=861299 RepID=W0REH6_9BACT|nr:amidohydrolase family protein [Gemmatirosa kalamazoonensis]AHG87778.1 amidohydrolase [Gemmatirosa kalamazoonensis]
MTRFRRLLPVIATAIACTSAASAQTSARPPLRMEARPLAAPASYARVNRGAPTYALVNGRWWDGARFVPRTFYAVEGILREARPARVDSTIDLAGRWVVPPFGDAHSHNLYFARARMDSVRDAYVREGTFYVQILGNSASKLAAVRDHYNTPCAIDIVAANGILTPTDGHGIEVAEALALGYRDPWAAIYDARADTVRRSRLAEDDQYWRLDDVADVEAKWPRILAAKPDLIKITIIGTPDASGQRPSWPERMWFMRGLSEAVVRAVVSRAHAAGLRVAAHIETARDFEVAVRDGVDVIAHMLGPDFRAGEETAYRIGDDVARMAAERGVVVVPTVAITLDVTPDPDDLARVQAVQRENLRRLAEHGVRIAIGRDEVWHTAREELDALRGLGVLDTPSLLRAWTETPRTIFPGRRIGRLADGYEASFLALGRDPLANLDAVRDVAMRVKQGCVLP